MLKIKLLEYFGVALEHEATTPWDRQSIYTSKF